ncbi:hypothetical protein LTS16_017157 [Friedmanniomyces endolithicus]|nr:hypothetical protein LTS09_010838 [Friedmanniomyces endolithicus]KAK0290182.1 hypothetical protein LTR35_002124 [Friedmanniomyces endolithicus]KAK1032495.1 hypothetical protein LTS16_017157 [Friedmanniomyces endolithicus]
MASGKKHGKPKKPKKTERPRELATSLSATAAHEQADSRLMQLPRELRDLIYAFVFCSTRSSYGRRAFGRIDHRSIVSANRGKALSLLRTCRRVNVEIDNEWLSQVLFYFEDSETLLDKLANISNTWRSQIRNIQMSGLPCLNLSKLTILGSPPAVIGYETLDMLIRYSDGWKELHYLSHDSELLGYAYTNGPLSRDPDVYLRQPQPAVWQKALEERDGQASHPSVTVYRSTDPTPCSVLDPNKRTVFSQHYGANEDPRTYCNVEDPKLMSAGERTKELLVIVKRGVGVEYAEKKQPAPLACGDIREDSAGRTWEDIKAVSKAICPRYSDEDDELPFDDPRDELIVDSYNNIEEYTWPPLHFNTHFMVGFW